MTTALATPRVDYDRLWPAVAAVFAEMDTTLRVYRTREEAGKYPRVPDPIWIALGPLLNVLTGLGVIDDATRAEIVSDEFLESWSHIPTARELCGFGPAYATAGA